MQALFRPYGPSALLQNQEYDVDEVGIPQDSEGKLWLTQVWNVFAALEIFHVVEMRNTKLQVSYVLAFQD